MRAFPTNDNLKHRLFLFFLSILLFSLHTTITASINKVKSEIVVYKGNDTQTIITAIKLTVPDGWHIYSDQPGDVGRPTRVNWTHPNNGSFQKKKWPIHSKFSVGGVEGNGYSGTVILPYLMSNTPTKPFTIKATVDWIVCQTECVPESVELSTQVISGRVTNTFIEPDAIQATQSRHSTSTIFAAILGGLIGGLLLNLMPCVFPVLSLKVLSYSKLGHSSSSEIKRDGITFSSGIMASIWILASVILLFRKGTESLGWGFQLQSPLFITGLIIIFTLLAANLFGVFEMGLSLTRVNSGKSSGSLKTFLNGALVAVVATPCTAPFMGVALGVAITQPALISLLIFSALGLGLSLPYLGLAFFPQLVQKLPKPGPWMETLKQGLGFPMLATVIWLQWVLLNQIGTTAAAQVSLGIIVSSFWIWAYGKSQYRDGVKKYVYLGLCILTLGLTLFAAMPNRDSPKLNWQPFSPKAVEESIADDQNVFVEFTADWCLTCQYNKQTILSSAQFVETVNKHKIQLYKADWTNHDPVISDELKKFGRSGVPVYVLYVPNKSPKVFSSALSVNAINAELN